MSAASLGKDAYLLLLISLAFGLATSSPSPKANKPAAKHTGWMTPYPPGPKNAPGSCGIGADESQDVVAISHIYFKGKNGNGNPHCGKKVKVKYHDKTAAELKIIDLCNACGEHDLDIAMKPFQKLTGVKDGKHGGVSWEFL